MAIINQGEIITQGPKSELTQSLNGKVWKAEFEESHQTAIEENHQVLSIKSVGSKRHARVLSEVKPSAIFTSTKPVLEDVYFSSLQTAQKK